MSSLTWRKNASQTTIEKSHMQAPFLARDAKLWFTPYVDKDTGEIDFESYLDFLKELRRSFGDPNRIATAEVAMEKLTQTGSIDLYYSKFREYMDVLDWSEATKVYKFRTGLKESIKTLLTNRSQYTEEKDFETLYINARKAENDLDLRAQESRGSSGHTQTKSNSNNRNNKSNFSSYKPSPKNNNSTAYGTHSGPMDLNAAPRKTFNSRKNYTQLSKEEKEQRFKKGQCFYCKETGHYVSECPKAKKNGSQGNWRKPDNRKALAASTKDSNNGTEKGKVVYSLGRSEESKN